MRYNLKLNGKATSMTPPSYEIEWEGRKWAMDKGWRAVTKLGTRKGLSFATLQLDKAKKKYAMEPHKTKRNYFSVWSSYFKTRGRVRSTSYNKGWKR
jgi:hypothetical protein